VTIAVLDIVAVAAAPVLERKSIEVHYGNKRYSFQWLTTTPPSVLLQKLCASLDPTADPRLLELIDDENDECDLCDSLETNAVLRARFLDCNHTAVLAVSASVLAEVVGVGRPVSHRHKVITPPH
jgi:hypothetical protein